MKQRSPQRVVKSLKNLRDYLNGFAIPWTSKPLASKIDECIYGEHTNDSLFLIGQDVLDINKTKERSAPKIVKNLIVFQEELNGYQRNFLVSCVRTYIYDCLYKQFNPKGKL